MAIFSHSGSAGDLVYHLACLRFMGGGSIYLYKADWFIQERIDAVLPLLRSQAYITKAEQSDGPRGLDLSHWRDHWKQRLNLTDMCCDWLHLPHPSRQEPWLFVEPQKVSRVVMTRTERYHNDGFPWKKVVEKYGQDAVFLGLPDEHERFVQEFGHVNYLPTKDYLEAAQIVAGAELVVSNQTCLASIAEGLKKWHIQETVPANHWAWNCHWDRPGKIHGYDQSVELPDLDEGFAVACACAAQDRSLVPGDRRLQLARLALSCADIPGDAAELGVYKGGTAAVIAAALPNKTLHLYDTFEGIPADDVLPGGHKKGDFTCPVDDVRRFLAGYKVVFHVGVFPKTAVDTMYSFVHLDADTYQSTTAALDFFLPRLSPGGVICFDDFGWRNCPGVERAIQERGLKIESARQQAWFRKS